MDKQLFHSAGFFFLMIGLFFLIVFASSLSGQSIINLNDFVSVVLGILFLVVGVFSLNASRIK